MKENGILGVNCSIKKSRSILNVIIFEGGKNVYRHVFTSPSIFSFKKDTGEILNWHRDNIHSLITQFQIKAIVVKKTEIMSFHSRPKKPDIFKLYLEGMTLSLAGGYGVFNKHYYKNNIKAILGKDDIFEDSIDEIIEKHSKKKFFNKVNADEIDSTRDLLLSVLAIEKELNDD